MDIVELVRALADGRAASALLLDFAIKGSVILVVAVGLSLAFRRASASLRHLVWSLALVAVLALPMLAPFAPRWSAPGLPEIATPATPAVESAPVRWEAESRPAAESRPEAPPLRRDDRRRASQVKIAGVGAGVGEGVTAAGVESTDAGRSGLPWAMVIVLVWIAGALIVLASVVAGLVRAWQLESGARELTAGPLNWMVADLAAELGITRRVKLLVCSGSCMPMTWGVVRPRILLPRDALEWPSARLHAVLVHELAHIKRLDYFTQLLARVTCALHWFNPLVWFAAARLRVERELACDDQVLRSGSRASEYAGHILDVARSLRSRPLTSVTTVAMARPSQLSDRLRAVLDGGRAREPLTPKVAASAWLSAALLVLPIAGAVPKASTVPHSFEESALAVSEFGVPELAVSQSPPEASFVESSGPRFDGAPAAAACDWTARGGNTSTSINVDKDRWRVEIKRDDCELTVKLDGELVFNESETDITGIERGGELEIEEKENGQRLKIVIERERDGSLTRRWYVNNREQPYGDEASAWLSEMILVLFRRVGYQASERAERILARGGVDALLQEIQHIPGDWTARRYYTVLLTRETLEPEMVARIVRQVGEDIESDHQLAQMLIAVAENQSMEETVVVAYVEAAKSIQSDHSHRQVLSAILQREDLSAQAAQEMLESATMLDSDHELARLLIEIIETRPIEGELVDPYFDAVRTIGSDFEQRRVLSAALHRGDASTRFLNSALEAARDISSDHELSRLLIEVSSLYPMSEQIPDSYLAAAASIDSDFELSRVLMTLIERGNLGPGAINSVLEISLKIQSDHEMSRVLTAVANEYGVDAPISTAYFRAVDTIGSDFECSRVLSAVLSMRGLTDETVEAVLASALSIDSDHEMGSLLTRVAEQRLVNDATRAVFMRAVDTIGSEYQRDRVLAAAGMVGA